MTQTEELKLALEALKKSDDFLYNWHENYSDDEADAYAAARQLNEQAIIAAEKALAQPEQEPVAWMVTSEMQDGTKNTYPLTGRFKDVKDVCDFGNPVPLYTTSPQRTWVGLTGEEMDEIWADQKRTGESITRAIETKLKEKNT